MVLRGFRPRENVRVGILCLLSKSIDYVLVGSELRVRVSVADRLRVEIIQGIRCGVRDNIGID